MTQSAQRSTDSPPPQRAAASGTVCRTAAAVDDAARWGKRPGCRRAVGSAAEVVAALAAVAGGSAGWVGVGPLAAAARGVVAVEWGEQHASGWVRGGVVAEERRAVVVVAAGGVLQLDEKERSPILLTVDIR